MFEKLIQEGDRVRIRISLQDLARGFNPCPDRTEATVTGFSEIHYPRLNGVGREPGWYVNRMYPIVELADGTTLSLECSHLEFVDQELATTRQQAWDNLAPFGNFRSWDEYLRPLPPTQYWEGDIVYKRLYVTSPSSAPKYTVRRIQYDLVGTETPEGKPYPIYVIALIGATKESYASDDHLNLYSRGNTWRYAYGEAVRFDSIEDEAVFFARLGRVYEFPNPATGLYMWSLSEIVAAIQLGFIHSIDWADWRKSSSTRGSFRALRYYDASLARRLQEYTLSVLGKK